MQTTVDYRMFSIGVTNWRVTDPPFCGKGC